MDVKVKLFKATFEGYIIRGSIIVRAKTKKQAEDIIKKKLQSDEFLSEEDLHNITEIPENEEIVHFFNGDY